MTMWMIDGLFGLVMALIGAAGGWWLRGRSGSLDFSLPKPPPLSIRPRKATHQALEAIEQVTDNVHQCIAEHIECIRAIETQIQDTATSEPSILAAAITDLRKANREVQREFDGLQSELDSESESIRQQLDYLPAMLLTTLSLDRQKHTYRKVLGSLQSLATELSSSIDEQGNRLAEVTRQVSQSPPTESKGLTAAIAEMLEIGDDLETKVSHVEGEIDKHAEVVQMQAVMCHTDVLTSLPNRRAFDLELSHRDASQSKEPDTIVFIDLDDFAKINAVYGHPGGDIVLRRVASILKNAVRTQDSLARYGGELFAIRLPGTTLATAIPLADKIRRTLTEAQFTEGMKELSVHASLGLSQSIRGELLEAARARAELALQAAKQAGKDCTWWNDGKESHPAQVVQGREAPVPQTLDAEVSGTSMSPRPEESQPELSGRSMFYANVKRRIAEWRRGGPTLSVLVMTIDQYPTLVQKCGPSAKGFLHQVAARLLEAATRDMDDRCIYNDSTFAILLPSADTQAAIRIADRLRSQVVQCKVRINSQLWELSPSIGITPIVESDGPMEILQRAEAAALKAQKAGGNSTYLNDPTQPEPLRLSGWK